MSRREHDAVGAQYAAVVQHQLEFLRCRLDRGNARVHERRTARCRTLRQGTQRVLDVVAVDSARCEVRVADREPATAAPAHEVLGILGEQAHTVGTRVEQVLGTLGTVRGAAAETTARFDEGDVDVIATRARAGAQPRLRR